MKHTSVVMTQTAEGYVLTTILGNPLGQRLITVSPPIDGELPEIPSGPIASKLDAERLKLHWNLYLRHAWKHRSKSRDRSAE